MKGLNVGIEIECSLKQQRYPLVIQMYNKSARSIDILPNWEFKGDGSLRTEREGFKCWEIVSKPAKTRKEWLKNVNSFYAFFSKRGREDLNNVLEFNDTTGAHISFSYNPIKRLTKRVHFKIFTQLREDFFKYITESNILSEVSKTSILISYKRTYALFCNRGFKQGKYHEFNISREVTQNGRIEWRAPTMRGLTTWAEYFEFMNIVYRCVENFINTANKYNLVTYSTLGFRGVQELLLLKNRVEQQPQDTETVLKIIDAKRDTLIQQPPEESLNNVQP